RAATCITGWSRGWKRTSSSRTPGRSRPRSRSWDSWKSGSGCRWSPCKTRPGPACAWSWERSACCRAPRMSLRERVEALAAQKRERYGEPERTLFAEFRAALTRGEIRAAGRAPDGAWCVNAWVKQGILLGFRMGVLADMAAPIGGGLERVGGVPVIIEDDTLVGGGGGVYEGTIVRERAVLAPGTILTGSTPVYDLVRDQVYRRAGDGPLEIPAGAVVVPGARGAPGASAARWGISLYAPVIVKYRDEKTDAATLLEEYLR